MRDRDLTEEQLTCAPVERAETAPRRPAKRTGLLSGIVGLGAFTVLTVVVVGLLTLFLPTFSGSAAVVLPAEFENHQGLLLAWDHDVPAEPERALAEIVAASYSRTQVLVLVPDSAAQ